MRPHDPNPANKGPNLANTGAIIPFTPRAHHEKDGPVVSTIVAVVAVTLLHDRDENAEDRLAELIESSGQAEIVEMSDAFADDPALGQPRQELPTPTNDNQKS